MSKEWLSIPETQVRPYWLAPKLSGIERPMDLFGLERALGYVLHPSQTGPATRPVLDQIPEWSEKALLVLLIDIWFTTQPG